GGVSIDIRSRIWVLHARRRRGQRGARDPGEQRLGLVEHSLPPVGASDEHDPPDPRCRLRMGLESEASAANRDEPQPLHFDTRLLLSRALLSYRWGWLTLCTERTPCSQAIEGLGRRRRGWP